MLIFFIFFFKHTHTYTCAHFFDHCGCEWDMESELELASGSDPAVPFRPYGWLRCSIQAWGSQSLWDWALDGARSFSFFVSLSLCV